MVRETRHLWVTNQPEIVREDRIRDHFKRSTEDVSPQSFEPRGSSYYERNSRIVTETDQYIRRPNTYHASDLRGRTRDRLYRNGPCPYPSIIDRNIPTGHHRVSGWYDSSPSSISTISGPASSPAPRSVYGNVASAVVQPDTSLYDCQVFKNKKKSRSGSESPCGGSGSVNATSSHSSSHIVDRGNGGSAASSRSHSRSPSSCSSTNSTSSNSHASSPVSGSDPPLSSTSSTTSRTRNLQSAVSAPNQSGNPVVHSEDNRPLAICVRNLPARSSDTSLKDGLFHEYKKHGKVTWVKVVGQNSERYALVCFKKPDDVEKALEVSHDKLFFGCKIEVAPYQGYDVEDNEFRPYEAELDEYHPKSTRTLFIGNLEKDITGSDIRNHFECFGEIIEIDIKKQGLNAYAFCQYSDIVSVVKAMRKMDGEHLGNNRIKLGFGKSMPTNCVWIDGIVDCVSENYLSQQFKGYGPITEVVIDRDRKLALVSFEQVQYAQLAVKEMRGEIIRGRKLQVDFASRECRDKFCSKVEKQTAGSSSCNSTTERTNAAETASYVVSVPGTRFNRYGSGSGSGSTAAGGASSTTDSASTSQSRSRASSFSRHSNLNSTTTTGATTTTAAAASSLGGASSPGGTSSRGGVCSSSSISGGVVVGAGGNSSTTTSTNTTSTATGGTTAVAAASGGGGNGGSGSGASSGAGGTTPRGNRSRGTRHPDYDYAEQRFRNYDEYSQGSGASHDDESYNYPGNCTRSDSPQSRLGPIAGTNALDTLDTNSGRRRCDKSPGDIRNLQKERFQILEQLEECPSSGDELVSPKKRMKFDHSSHHHNHHHTISSLVSLHMNNQHDKIDQQLLLLQTQSTQPLQQSQLLSSSSATLLSTAATTPTLDCALTNSSNNPSSSLQPNLLIGDSNCDVISNHSNETSSSLHHRKCVEVRRLSECSSLKYGTQLSSTSTSSNSRRPSTELSGAGATTNMLLVGGGVTIRHTGATSGLGQEATTPMAYVAPHSVPCKRRRTGAGLVGPTLTNSTSDTNEHHSSRGRGHQLNSLHSHEASGGESADGSRPGTPLCDERPEVSLCEPRRIPRDKPHEPMMLPLPKFGIQFFQQHRVAAATLGPAATSLSSHTGQLYSSISSSSSCSSSTTTNNNNMNSSNNLLNNTSSSSALLNSSSSHSSLSNTLSSPPLLVGTRLSAPSFHHHHSNSSILHSSSHHHHHQMQQQQQQQQHHHHHQQQHHMNYHHGSHTSGVEQPPASPLRARSLSSNSSDSDMAPISTSPSIEERLKSLDEMYEIWSGGGGSISARSHSVTTDHHSSTTPQSRHKFLELDVNEVKPSEFVKRVLAKKSIFDDDLQRLKNISDKYEPVDFSNLSRGSLVSTSPGIPNLAATKTPVVGGNPAAKQTVQAAVFHSPGVNQLQRLNSPMNSPQAMSPYNSPSPSPIVTTAMVSKAAVTQQTVVPAQPAKGLQYPFPSHPPVVMTPTTPPAPGTPQSKPKIASITKSFSLQEKSTTQTAQPTVPSIATTMSSTRVLCKSASVPGSTNVGTVKTSAVPALNTLPTSNTKSEENADATTTSSSRRSSADSSSTKCAYQRSVSANTSKKGDKAHKHNHRNDSDKKMTKSEKSRSESIDKRKSHSEEKDDTGDIHEKDTAVTSERLAEDERPKRSQSDMDKETVEKPATSSTNQKSEKEKSGRKEKRRDKEEKDREDREKKSADHEVERRECEEREKKEREERDRKERERREKEEKDRREREDRERREQEEMSRKEREDRERREELARKEREERERKEREERDRKEREERERKEREERERKEREERERKEREECARREREERERREREEITRREREERERREREEIIRRDREERERKEREEVLRREREERERKEREEGLRREREERERRDHEERERREKEESERREKEKEERERREKEKEERERRESEEHQQREKDERRERERLDRRSSHEERDVHDRKDYDETHERRDRKDREDRRPEIRNCETKDISTKEHHHHDDISKPDENHDRRDHRNKDDDYAHFRQSHHHHKEEKHHHKDSNENHAMNDDHSSQKRRERRSSGSSPIRITKRRLSSQDSMENEESAKRMKINAESRKLLDRLDSKDSNRSLSKHHKSHSRASSISKNSEEKLLNSEERYRKDSGFDEKKSKDKEHKKYDKNTSSSHKYKKLSISMEKDDHEIRSPTEKSSLFDQHELRSSDDEHQQQLRHRSKKEHKEKKRHEYDEDGHRRSSDSKRHDNNRHDRKSTGRSEDGSQKNSGEKSRNKPPSRKMTQSSNDSDSDEPKKHSIFDILDDGPYVSMYDKVKARSCKNMQKQEEEKKIKAKFSQLKQSRAKREEKKRSTSYDGDSDSDFDDRQGKYKSPYKMSRGGFINSSSDDDGSTINRHKDTPISDSDSDARRAQYNRDRLNQLCDGDSSEGGSVLGKSASCKKISLKRNSRSTRIVSDSSDTETSHRIKNENRENRQNDDINIKTEMKVEGDELESKTKVDRFGSLKSENLKDEPNDAYPLKMEIKIEPNDPTDDFYSSHISESETNVCSGSAVESKDSVFEQLFSPDLRKKHKKSKKRQKILANPPDNETTSVSEKFDDVKVEKHSPTSMENVFDELKRESSVTSTGAMSTPSQSQFSEKKKHKERKDKKRDKSREDYEKLSKEERHRLKKSKKSSKSCDGDRYGQDTNSVGSVKRGGEKMEDIFGPISDDETQLSLTDSIPKDSSTSRLYENISTSHTQQPVVSAALNPYKQEPLTPKSHTVEENEENKQKVNSHAERERHRKERREKKRKERERTREQHALAAFQQKHEDENSVDLDEAGRALEAQLMEDSDNKLTEETTPPTATTHKNEMGDVFRFSDGDENSMEVMSHEKKEQSEPHKNKEKKKKKKRSKEERHQKREHHHHSSTHNSSLPQPPQSSSKLSIEITTPTDITDEKQEDLCKPSPSLPCLLDESPPHKNNSSAELNLSISPLVREQPNLISPIPKTPTICSAPKPSECKKKPDKFIPGFDVELDDKISESAVKSISAEFNSPIVDPIVEETKAPIEIPAESKNIDKSIEEKSRVVISQEETEDAVAALLGESFGTSTVDYSFSDDPCEIQPEEEEHATQVPNEAIIPEEEAEEMRKAVQSLSNEEIDMKPDTPQSEQDLQIDTDTEETEEDTTTSTVATRFESTSKVEVPQIKSQAEPIVKAPPLKPEPVETPKATENEVKPPVILNTASVITKNTNELKPAKEEVAPKTVEVKVESEKPPETEKVESVRPQTIFPPTPQKTTTQSPVQPPKISVPSNLPASRAQTQFVMQPPTISIPEQTHFVYPPINVMLSPRAGNEHRMPSPRHVQQGSQIGQQSPAQFVNVRVSSPHSPNMHRGPSQTAGLRHPSQLSPVMPQHVVIQQRQLMSPPGSTPPQPQPPSSTNLTLNRIPVQSVLAPISKPIQPTNIILPQPNTAHASIVSRSETTSETKDSSKPVVGQPIAYQSVRVGTPTSGSAGSPVNTPGQSQSATIQVLNQPTIKSVIETHGASQIQQMGPIQVSQAKGPPHQTVVLQQQPPLKQPPHMPQSQSPRPPPPQQLQQMKIAQQQQLLQQHHLMQNRQHRKQLQQQQHKQLLQQQQAQQHAQMMQMQKQQQQQQQKHQQHSQQHQQQHRMMQQQVLQMQPYQQVQPQPLPKDTPHKATVSMPQQITQNIPNKEMQSTVCPPRISQNVVVVRQQSNIVSQSQQLSKPIIVQQQTQQAMSPQLPQTQQQPQPQPQQPQPVILQQRQPLLPLSQPSAVLLQSKPPPLPLPTSVQNVIHQAPAKVQSPLQPQPQEPAPPSTPLAINVKQQDDQICKVVENSESTVNPIEIKEKQQSVEPLIVEKISPKDDAPSTKESENVKITPPPMEVKKEPKVESKSLSPKQDLESVSVIKSQTAATPVQPVQSSLLTEENVSKFSVPVDDQLEQDSKEDSDYWSAKELNIESVIKKVDALCSNDEETEDQLLEKKGETKVDGLKTEPITVLKEIPEKTNAPSVVEQEQKTESVEIGSGVETEKGDDTHDEEEFDETTEPGKVSRGGKRTNRIGRGGKKMPSQPATTTANSPVPVNNAEGVQTRRGKNNQGVRGARKGRGGQSRSPAGAAVSVAAGEKKLSRNQNSDQDIYEFHDDSGEESVSSKSSDRPRLILTIKSPGQVASTVVQTKTAPSTPPQQTIPTVASTTPIPPAPVVQSQTPQPTSVPIATTPPQKDQKEKEEFTTPAINTRKSRRLLEKDGGGGNRNTVDDIIEDVVRNSSSPKSTSGGQTPPRRSTRNSAQVGTQRSTPPAGAPAAAVAAATDKVIVNLTDVRKSPRANRRSKDRKASETSVDSSDEKVVKPDEKSSPPKAQPVEIEAEKTAAKPEEVESTKQQPENPVKVTLPIPVVSNEKVPEKAETRKPLEPAEPLALIDPVTGLLTVVRQSKEGQYVPVPGAPAAPPNAKVVGKHIVQPIVAKPEIKPDELVKPKTLEPKQEAPSPLVVHKPTNVVVTTSIQPPTKVSSPISVVASSNIVQVPVPTVQVVVQPQPPPPQKVQLQQHVHQPVQPQTHPQPQLHAQPQPQPQPQLQPQPQKIIQSHPQPQPQPQPQPIRTHPLKAHVLNSQHNMALNKPPIVSQSVVKVATGIIGQPTTTVVTNPNVPKQPQQNTVVQSNIVTRHIPQSNVPQQPQQAMHPNQMPQQPTQQSLHNLFVNIPPSSSPHTVQMSVAHSPRIQQNVVVKSDQSQPSPQQPLQLLHVVTKPMGGGGQQQIITQQHQPVVIHNNKLQPPQNQYATVVQGGKIIQQAPIQNAVGKHQTIQVAIPHVQQQHQQLQHHQKQSPAVSVVTHQLGKQVPMPNQQQHQQPHPNMQSHHLQQQPQQQPGPHHMSNAIIGKQQSVLPNAIHLASGQQPGIVLGSQHIVTHAHQSMHPHQPTGATLLQAKPAHQQQVPPPTKGVIGLHQSPQIMTGAVASPPLKQSHMASQQPIVTGASSLRASVPPISPQGQSRSHMLQPGHPAPAFEANLHDIGGFGAQRSQSPPPAHQQASPITPGEGTFAGGSIRGMPREHYIMYPPYFRTQQEARIPYIPRSTLVQGSATDQKDLSEVDESMAASPPLELRRPGSGSRTISVPHSLQSPQDRATDSPQVAQVYVHGSRIPHPHFQDIGARYFENVRQVAAEPPPAHRPAHSVVAPSPTNYAPQPSPGPPVTLTHIHPKVIERERDREQRERENESRYFVDEKRERERVQQRKRENERSSIPGHTSMPNHDSLVPAMPAPTGRSIQVATPPHASQVPPQGDSLLTLLQRYPVMWQGLLALKTDQAAVQMHFVFGNPLVARGSLPCNSDGSTPPLRIAQRMRLEQTQLEGVAKKMQYENEHCMLLALPCGRNHMDVLQQSRNLQTGFITYLQQKMAAGIVNIPVPGSDQAAYVVHIFPSCDFANENLERAAPDLKHRVAEIAHLLIVIATV